jgi:formamidopyrimidine-DNA glycosylase
MRRGKFINIFLEKEFVITIHLRMTGRLIVQSLGDEALKYERTRLDFEDISLRFCDLRKFGRVWINKVKNYEQNTGIFRLGLEPLDAQFSLKTFVDSYKNKRGSVKKNLLDQSLVTGIGNIYADESCFYAGIRPDREMSSLNKKELEKLFDSVIKALNQGIKNRGTSVSDYEDAYGKSGKNQELLYVYGRGNQDCLKCSTQLIKVKHAGRGTVYCESCQS